MTIRLLVVDGYAAYRETLMHLLRQREGFGLALEARSLAEAVECITHAPDQIDVALVGSDLPDGDAVELRPHLHAYFPSCHLVLFGLGPSRREIGRAIAFGASGAYSVETPLEELLQGITRLVAGTSVISRAARAELLHDAGQLVVEERAVRAALSRLTPREWEILELLAQGLSDKDAAARLGVSSKTVAAHMANLLKKLNVESRLQAVLLALRFGVISLDSPDGPNAAP